MNNIFGTKMRAMDKKQQKRLANDTKQKAAFCWSPAKKKRNVMTLIRKGSDFSFFAAFYCYCLGFNEVVSIGLFWFLLCPFCTMEYITDHLKKIYLLDAQNGIL